MPLFLPISLSFDGAAGLDDHDRGNNLDGHDDLDLEAGNPFLPPCLTYQPITSLTSFPNSLEEIYLSTFSFIIQNI